MRKLTCFSMFLLFLITAVTGFIEMHVHPDRPAEFHIAMAILFSLSILTHVLINRKALIRYIAGSARQPE